MQAEPALGTGGGSGLRCGRPGGGSVARSARAAFCCRARPNKTRRLPPWARRLLRVCVSSHRLFGRRWPLIMARKWSSSRNWSRQLTCAPPFARHYFPRGSRLHKIREELLGRAAERLNERPRTCFYRTRLPLKFLTLPSLLHLQVACIGLSVFLQPESRLHGAQPG